LEGAAPPWLRRHHTKLHGWTKPEAAVVLGRPEQDDQGDILRVRGAEKRVHQGASDPSRLVVGKDADRTHCDHGVETDLRATCGHMTDNRVLSQRSKRQLINHVLRLPKCGKDSHLGWHTIAVILSLERFCVDNLRCFVVARLLWSDDHAHMVARAARSRGPVFGNVTRADERWRLPLTLRGGLMRLQACV